MKILTAIALLLGGVLAALAHDMYILPATFRPAKGTGLTAGFHVGDSFPDSEVSGRIDRLQNPRLIGRYGSAPFRNLRVEGHRDVADVIVETPGELIAAVSTTPTLIQLEPEKFTAYLKEEGLSEVSDWRAAHGESGKPGRERYSKYAKSILLSGSSDGFFNHVVGFPIEIIPEADPYQRKPGDELPIRILFRGRPAAGLQVESSWAGQGPSKTTAVGRTGPDGRLKVPLASAGRWRLHSIKMERCAEPAVADWESFWASLTFELQ